MLVIAILIVGAILMGGISLRQHPGNWRRAALDTCAWLLVAVAGVTAVHFWPNDDLVLLVALLAGVVAATLLRSFVKV